MTTAKEASIAATNTGGEKTSDPIQAVRSSMDVKAFPSVISSVPLSLPDGRADGAVEGGRRRGGEADRRPEARVDESLSVVDHVETKVPT
ncbi:hypothetical protein GCM10009673_22120 [Nesterenkonia sandarakina]